jgi:hypothetical protein
MDPVIIHPNTQENQPPNEPIVPQTTPDTPAPDPPDTSTAVNTITPPTDSPQPLGVPGTVHVAEHKKSKRGWTVFLIILIMALAAGVGWYVWQNHKPKTTSQNTSTDTTSNTTTTQPASEPLVLDATKLPAGWLAETNDSAHILLSSKDTKCFTDVMYTTDTAESNAPDVNHNKQTVDAIKAKGYKVVESPSTLTIVTNKGEKQLEAQALQITGLSNPMSQKYAYISEQDSYTQIQLSCPNNTQLPTAQAALSAVTFNKAE